jgi:outer membrane receptor protein involved in Fe transport
MRRFEARSRAGLRHELLATTILVTLGATYAQPVSAQTMNAPTSGAVALPTIDVEGSEKDGGRFTGYSVDLDKPAAASKSNIPLIRTPGAIQVVPREVLDDQQAISVQDAIVGNASSVTLTGPQVGAIAFTIRGSTSAQPISGILCGRSRP